jgi:hypothetical protein
MKLCLMLGSPQSPPQISPRLWANSPRNEKSPFHDASPPTTQHNVARQPELVYAHGSQLGRSGVEQPLLAFLAAVSLNDHDRDAHVARRIHNLLHQFPRDRLQQHRISHAIRGTDPGIFRNDVREKFPMRSLAFSLSGKFAPPYHE